MSLHMQANVAAWRDKTSEHQGAWDEVRYGIVHQKPDCDEYASYRVTIEFEKHGWDINTFLSVFCLDPSG